MSDNRHDNENNTILTNAPRGMTAEELSNRPVANTHMHSLLKMTNDNEKLLYMLNFLKKMYEIYNPERKDTLNKN